MNNYFSNNPTYTPEIFRRIFHMRKSVFLRIVDAITTTGEYFRQRPDATVVTRQALINFVEGVISCFGDEYLKKGLMNKIQLDYSMEKLKTNNYFGSSCIMTYTCNDINVLHRSPIFNDVLEGQAPKVGYIVNGRKNDRDKIFIGKIVMTCIIIHNMIIENERDTYQNYYDPT
ncbi:hypothetical protein ACS0TY_015716 [Phlomoides rotata]